MASSGETIDHCSADEAALTRRGVESAVDNGNFTTEDYTQTIEIEGGTTITLHGDGQNGQLITNFK